MIMAERWEFVDGDGLVAPDRWPYRPGEFGLAWVEEMRVRLGRIEKRTRETAEDIGRSWQALRAGGVYEAPEAQALQGAMGPVVRDAKHEAEICRVAAKAADEYAMEISGLDGCRPSSMVQRRAARRESRNGRMRRHRR